MARVKKEGAEGKVVRRRSRKAAEAAPASGPAEVRVGVRGAIVMRPVEGLKPHPKNSKTHPPEQVARVAASIKQFGFNNPVLIKDEMIITGHARVLAAKQLGMQEVPTLDASHLSDDEVRAYVIADNKLAEQGGWDRAVLRDELSYLEGASFVMDTLGFNDAELGQLLADQTGERFDPNREWQGMPEFAHREDVGAFRSVVVHFKDQKGVDDFAKRLGCKLTDKTKFVWFPPVEIESYVDKRYTTSPGKPQVRQQEGVDAAEPAAEAKPARRRKPKKK